MYHRQQSVVPQSPAARPEDLHLTTWYGDETITGAVAAAAATNESATNFGPTTNEQLSSYPSAPFGLTDSRSMIARADLNSTRGSSAESEVSLPKAPVPRKAYMDLSDAMALLDETCPNPDASPSLTPRTPRTPLTPHPRNKRARSKSSDNSSNYSSDRLSEKDSGKEQRERRRPFLKKIGISKTEDRPFLSKIAPKIVGKPYLEKIGPSKAVEKPFLDKIGSSKTIDKFSFDAIRDLPRAMIKRTHTTTLEPTIQRSVEVVNFSKDTVLVVEEETTNEQPEVNHVGVERKRSGKGLLLKMYSFETEDLDEDPTMMSKKEMVRGESLDVVLDCEGPSSLPTLEDIEEPLSPSKLDKTTTDSMAALVKCRVTTSEEIVSLSTGQLNSPSREVVSWSNSPRWPLRSTARTLDSDFGSKGAVMQSDEESIPNSPTKWRTVKVSPTMELPIRMIPRKSKNLSLPRDLDASPTKSRRQGSEELLDIDNNKNSTDIKPSDEVNRTTSEEMIISNSRRNFEEAMEKFGGSDFKASRARRQGSEDILDKSDAKENSEFEPYKSNRRGISSDNLRYSRETVVGSAPSASSLGYQSGDSSFISQRSSNNSSDMLRGTFKHLHEKFELEVPPESYAAFKIRSRANYRSEERQKFMSKETTIGPTIQAGKVYDIKYKESDSQEMLSVVDNKDENGEDRIDDRKVDDSQGKQRNVGRSGTVKSVLRKQERVDHSNDNDVDTTCGGSVRRPMRRIYHEPSQETMDLLTELKKVKSSLRTPSEEGKDWELDCLKPARLPKMISLSDKEFCLSVERENSIRRPAVLKIQQKVDEVKEVKPTKSGLALFEKRCLSLDYADDAKPPRPEARAISLASARRSATDETLDSSDPCLLYDSKSNLSDVFTTPTDEDENNHVLVKNDKQITSSNNNHFQEVDIAIPIDQKSSISPNRRVQIQGRTSDLYEIISPRATPFRVKKRLGRISVEETVKPENFTLDSKVDCRSLATQKRTKCFPL
uniref:Uncharacterized protein n=1 Tax=Bracon brevicornis TaxID=1563983 RepID=A0A6V7M4R9_9HYME